MVSLLMTRMAQPLIGVRLNPQLLAKAKRVTREQGFSSVQELVRSATRNYIEEYEKQRAIEQLNQLAGSATAAPKTKEELAQLAEKLFS